MDAEIKEFHDAAKGFKDDIDKPHSKKDVVMKKGQRENCEY